MKKQWISKCFAALIFTLALVGCSQPIADLREVATFTQAKPVWAEGRETEKNLTLYFREQFNSYFASTAYVKLTASCDYRLKVNGEFVAHGPSVAAHDFYRIDCYDIKPYLPFTDSHPDAKNGFPNSSSFFSMCSNIFWHSACS